MIPIIYFMMATMIYIDTLAVANLIVISLKFKTLKKYFESIKDRFLMNCKKESIEFATKKMRDDFLNGILMHQELLR